MRKKGLPKSHLSFYGHYPKILGWSLWLAMKPVPKKGETHELQQKRKQHGAGKNATRI